MIGTTFVLARESTQAQRRATRVLTLSVAASIAVHVIVLVAFQGIGRRNAPRIEPIEVTLSKPEPPRIVAAPAVEPPREKPEKARPKEEARRAQHRAKAGVSPPAPEPPLLALPQTPLAQTPPVQMPMQKSEPPLSAAEAKPEVSARAESASAASAAKADTASSPPQATSASAAKGSRGEMRDASLIDSSVRYPRTAEKGRVTLKVLVTREGRAATVNLEKSSGYPNLDQHALQAVRRWRFTAARQGNEPVEQWMTVNVDY